MQNFLYYSEFEGFWERLAPLTPFGKAVKDSETIYKDAESLEKIWDHTGIMIDFLRSKPDTSLLSRMSYHLRRLPRFPETPRSFDEAEIYEFKKFLYNYSLFLKLVPEDLRSAFHLEYTSEALLKNLSQGFQSSEAFYIADEYSPELSAIRHKLKDIDQELRNLRQTAEDEAEAMGLFFGGRDFIIVAKSEMPEGTADSEIITDEAYDAENRLLRLRPTAHEIKLRDDRTELLGHERHEEGLILEKLSGEISLELPKMLRYCEAVCHFDMALARANLAIDYNMTRPRIGGRFSAKNARFIPCEESCASFGTTYQPLTLTLDSPVTVLFGSNMGGKTILLKTLAFLQMCVQTGLYVPAESLETRLYDNFSYIGEGRTKASKQGLSGFGYEVYQFQAALQAMEKPSFILFDEFARTTNSREAEALITAITADICRRPHVTALFSTHFKGIKRHNEAVYLRMKGLDKEKLRSEQGAGLSRPENYEEHIRLIDSFMDYSPAPDDGIIRDSDALAIAGLLGIPEHIIQIAEKELS